MAVDNVRLYPNPAHNPVTIVVYTGLSGNKPKLPIHDLKVRIFEAGSSRLLGEALTDEGGEARVSVRADVVYPVAAAITVSDGTTPVVQSKIQCKDVNGLYPGDVWALDLRHKRVVNGIDAADASETLYNGIVLPREWPPRLADFPTSVEKDPVTPPYLLSPPAVISIDVGRQLFVDDYLDPIRPATGSEGTQWHTVVLTHDGTTSKTQNYLVGRKRPGYSALSFQDVVPGRRERCHRLRHFARWHPLGETFVGCAATDQHRPARRARLEHGLARSRGEGSGATLQNVSRHRRGRRSGDEVEQLADGDPFFGGRHSLG